MANNRKFIVGANLKICDLEAHAAWIVEGRRDVEIFDASVGEVLDGDWRKLALEARSILDGHTGRIGIHGPWDGLPLLCRDLQVRRLVIERLKQALEFAVELNATQMVLHSPFEFYGSPMVAHTVAHGLNEEIDLVHQTLEEILPLAQQANCAMALEVCYDTNSIPLIRLVESFKSPWVGLSLDTGHACIMQRLGGPPADQWVRDAGPLLTHVHLEDTDGLLDRHWAPGEGSVNWYALFDALREMIQPPRLILEVKPAEKTRQGANWLEQNGYLI